MRLQRPPAFADRLVARLTVAAASDVESNESTWRALDPDRTVIQVDFARAVRPKAAQADTSSQEAHRQHLGDD